MCHLPWEQIPCNHNYDSKVTEKAEDRITEGKRWGNTGEKTLKTDPSETGYTTGKGVEKVSVQQQTRLGLEERMILLQGLSVKIKTMGLKTLLLVIRVLISKRDWMTDQCVCVCLCTIGYVCVVDCMDIKGTKWWHNIDDFCVQCEFLRYYKFMFCLIHLDLKTRF